MYELMYYGGFAAAIGLLILSLLFFIIFRVPSIHRYFRRNSRKGLVEAEVITGKLKQKKPAGPKKVTREEYEARTEVLTMANAGTEQINPDRTDFLATGEMNTTSTTINQEEPGAITENLEKTDLL